MKRILSLLAASLASLGLALAAGPALAQKAEAPKAKTEAPKAAEAPKTEQMDINSASEKELATLKGIGDARAKAIIKHRPYKGKDDLVKKKIIPQNVYDDIKDQIIAKQDMAKKEAAPAAKKDDAKKK